MILDHYELERIADVDMALWVAAQLGWTDYPAIRKEMQQDRFFQRIRLRNMMDGLGRFWEHTERARLTLAEVVLRHDHVLAALIATRPFERKVVEMAAQRGIPVGPRFRETKLLDLVRRLKQSGPVPADVDLDELRKYRNQAVHDFEPPISTRPISRNEAEEFVSGVGKLWGFRDRA